MSIARKIGLALMLIPVPGGVLSAQGSSVLKPKVCLATEELFADRVPAPKTAVRVLNLPGEPPSLLTIDPIRVDTKGIAVRDLVGAVQLAGPLPVSGPGLLLQLHVVDTIERPIEQRQLSLFLDDEAPVELGSMRTYLLSKPGGKKVEQNLTVDLRPNHFRSLVAAGTGRVRLGDMEFPLSAGQLNGLRSLYTVAVCGKS